MWQSLTEVEKKEYFTTAKNRDAEHKKIYPDM
jgi:hypothetical protein